MPSKKSRIQFYADECFPVTSVTHLRSLGYSIIHAFDKKLIDQPDLIHLKTSKQLRKILITLDRDFIYYNKANLNKHPGVIVVSSGSPTPENVSKVCEKLLKNINKEFSRESLIKVTTDKIIKIKNGKVVFERKWK